MNVVNNMNVSGKTISILNIKCNNNIAPHRKICMC
jgi:hypothetical protein